MTIVIKHYTSANGLTATISLDKYCKAFSVNIARPIIDNPGFAQTIRSGSHASIAAAKAAIKRFDNTFTEDKQP